MALTILRSWVGHRLAAPAQIVLAAPGSHALVAVAQTRRVHFAKKLDRRNSSPHDAGGDGGWLQAASGDLTPHSVNLYGRSPRELRSLTARHHNGAASGHYTFHLGYRPPYHWKALIDFLAARAIPGVEIADRRSLLPHHPA